MMDNSDDIHLVSLPGAEDTEPTTILEELNRNLIDAVVTQAADNDANENERAQNVNVDNVTNATDVGESSQLTEIQSEVTNQVNQDNNQTVDAEKLCDNDRFDGIEILNFTLQTVDDAQTDEKPNRTETIDEVDRICEEDKDRDNVVASSNDLKSDSKPSTSSHDNTGSLQREVSPPPVPLVTYRWEDVRRDKQKGGYPWTYLDPHEPRPVALNKDSSEGEQYRELEEPGEVKLEESKDLRDLEEIELSRPEVEIDFEEKLDFEPVSNEPEKPPETKTQRTLSFLKRALPSKKLDVQKANQSPSSQPLNSPTNSACCHPLVEKLKTMADKQLHKAKQYRAIKKHPLRDDERIELSEPHQILKLKESPKADRKEIASYVVKQDSDDVLEIIDLDESPSEIRRHREEERSTIVSPDEIIELPLSQETTSDDKKDAEVIEPTVTEVLETEVKRTPPPKSPRKQKEHVYEEIDQPPQNDPMENDPLIDEFISNLSLRKEENEVSKSEDEVVPTDPPVSSIEPETEEDQNPPTSTVKSTLDVDNNKVPLSESQKESDEITQDPSVKEKSDETKEPELKSLLKREASPCSDKKVTFSMSTDDNSDEPHREDVDLPEHVKISSKWSKMSDHEYEPIGESNDTAPVESTTSQDLPSQHESKTENQEDASSITSHERKLLGATNTVDEEGGLLPPEHIEEEILAPTPQTDHSRNDEICTSQIDSSAIEDLPLRREDRKKSFMASTSDKTRNVQRKLSKQADRLKSKFKEMQKPKEEDSPKSERKRFRSPEFNKLKNIKMPKISKPELKRPEFTKFKKPDFKFTKPEILKKYDGFSSLRLNRKKSTDPTESLSDESKITRTTDDTVPTKKRFDFGTYPRLFDRMRRDNRSGASGTTISRDTEPEEECDRVNTSGPVLFSTVPRSKKEKNKKPVRPQWAGGPSFADDESSSGKFKHYSLDRESSIEKRMRFDFKDSIDDDEGERGILQTEEQKQYADYDKENRAIHQISKAKEGEFRQRRPLVHQESDVVSEESNRELGWVDTDHLRDRLMAHSGDLDISQREDYVNEGLQDKDHVSTQETQSSGSSSNRRRKGVIEEIDDDEFFLRKKGISQDDIQIGKYISAAIREGLDTPVNALAQLTQRYEPYYDEDFDISNERVDYGYDVPPRKPRRVRDFEKSLSSEFNDDSGMMPYNNEADHDEDRNISPDGQFFRTYPPSRPRRKARKQQSEESQEEHEVPVAAQYYPHPDEDDHSFYENKHMEGIEQPDIKVTYNEEVNLDTDYATNQDQAPPKAPKRRKHLLRESVERDSLANNFVGRSVSNSYLTNENAEETVVFRTEHEYVPLVQPETFTTPTPTPRSRSKASPFTTDDDRTSRGAESLAFDDTKPSTDVKEANGYAVVKKEPPPRPPAPMRRKRSTRSLGDRQFFTMPLRRNQNDLAPERPVRNYSTIGPTRPIRPARRVSLNSLEKPPSITSDATQYEEIEDINHSGNADHKVDQNYKMKHRPLPPPPRPPRERKHRKSSESDGNKLDKDGGGEKITSIKNVLGDISRISSEEMEEIEEMERSTQTDPLPDDYLCEEFDINSDMPIIEPSFNRHSKTLEDILKEEQQAEMERARQIADENSLTKGIQKFREANQRSLSERSRGSTNDRPKTPSSRPITPSAVVIEKKTNLSTIETDAQLIVQPVDEDEINTASNIPYRNRFFPEDTVDTEDERIVNEALKRYNLLDSDFRDSSPQQDIELNIREVEPPIQTQTTEVLPIPPQETPPLETPPQEIPPQAPPRRKSSCAESTVVPIATECDENVPIPEEDRTDVESPTATMNLLPGNRLHINELEVEHLNVHDLQAGRILVSDLQAIAIASQDIECTSGDLTVKGIKIPASFLEELINRSRTTAIEEHYSEHEVPNQLTQEPTNQQTPNVVPLTEQNVVPTYEPVQEPEPPARPPPPRSLYPSDYAQYSLPPPSFYQLRSYPDEIEEVLPHSPTTTHRQRRRYHRRRDSTSEEEEQREHRRSRQHNNRSPEPSIGDLSGQLIRACGSAIGRGGVKLYSLMKEKKQEMKRRDVSIGVAILIFVVAFLMMIGIRGERTVHHHHWDYWNPPGSSGRP